MTQLQSYIAGRWIGQQAAQTLNSAIDGSAVAHTHAEAIDFGEALDHARRVGLPALQKTDFQQRAAMLKSLAKYLGERKEELYALSLHTGATRADGSWRTTLNQVRARIFNNVIEGSRRLRVNIMHPMDTGLVAGIPAFYIERLALLDAQGEPWWRLALHEPVSENPLLTFELPAQGPQEFRLDGQDNNGNRIAAEVRA